MSSYRRFITYLFWYENNDKKANCGFAKVEQRQNTGKMEIHIKNCPGQRKHVDVYFFTKEGTVLPMVLLGTVPFKKGTADALFQFDCKAVGGSSYSLDQIRGIVIPLDEGALAASLWDDEIYDWSRLTDKPDLPADRKEAESAKPEVDKKANDRENQIDDLQTEREENQADALQTGREENQADALQTGREENQADALQTEREENQVNDLQTEKEENQLDDFVQEKQITDTDPGNSLTDEVKMQSVPVPDPLADPVDAGWKQIQGLYPKIYPFYGDKNVWGVQAQLRDIKYLPQKFWPLGNNSFLLHGYFNYGTILMGYMESERRCFIGVPGIFQNQERVLASLFGFPEFRTQQQCIQKTGEFGYWYRFLDF